MLSFSPDTFMSMSKVKVLVTQSYLTLWEPMDCSPPGFSVHGIVQARILEWVAPSPGDLPNPMFIPRVSCITGRFFTTWATREVHIYSKCTDVQHSQFLKLYSIYSYYKILAIFPVMQYILIYTLFWEYALEIH